VNNCLADGIELPLSGTNDNDEHVILEKGKDDNGNFYRVTTAQKNNWCRINTYYEDGIVTEIYKK
jgi:hypothetical protein